MNSVRKPVVAGLFYPSNVKRLNDELDVINSITPLTENIKNIFGIVVPHAGYIYSGKTAAYAYNIIANKNFNKVIILSPSHREYFHGANIYAGDGFESPLGVVPVDKELSESISKGSKFISINNLGHQHEHAVEVQIPFLQKVLKDFSIIPIVIGNQTIQIIDELAQRIAENADENTLVVASSDLSHYFSKQQAFKMDSIVEEGIKNFDFDSLYQSFEERKCEACGAGPIITLMKAAKLKGFNKSCVLNRSDSGDVSGDNKEVVGYLSAVIYND